MARNAEKAKSLLNKWVTMKNEFNKGGAPDRRPFLSSECDDLGQAEKWRHEVIREISKNIGEIQNAGLGEHKIRDLNDHINKLLREKHHWQQRIKELGGGDYNASEPKSFDADGRELPGGGGYKYFGSARELPGVRELFHAEAPLPPRRTRAAMYKNVTPDYYGYRDEDDGTLVAKEAAAEKRAVGAEMAVFHAMKKQRKTDLAEGAEEAVPSSDEDEADETFGDAAAEASGSAVSSAVLKAHVPVPSQEVIKDAILAHRKEQLAVMFLGAE
jgi:pre-mRNA-splicing factor ISY1